MQRLAENAMFKMGQMHVFRAPLCHFIELSRVPNIRGVQLMPVSSCISKRWVCPVAAVESDHPGAKAWPDSLELQPLADHVLSDMLDRSLRETRYPPFGQVQDSALRQSCSCDKYSMHSRNLGYR